MKEIDEESLLYVVKLYDEGKYNVERAIRTFKVLTGEHLGMSRFRIASIAASICVALTLGIWGFIHYNQKASDEIILATTDSIKTFALPDGSEITLSPHSSIAFSRHNMEKGKRIISLQGKSYFSVYHDPLHPFIVNNKIGIVEVLGTVFQIDESRKGIMYVYVESGKVSLSNRQGNGTVFLTKGMNAVLKKNSKAPIILATGNRNQTTWATGIFRFSNTPITEVLKEISAYYHVNMTTNDTNKQLSGEFESHDINEIKKLIETTLCIKIKITQ